VAFFPLNCFSSPFCANCKRNVMGCRLSLFTRRLADTDACRYVQNTLVSGTIPTEIGFASSLYILNLFSNSLSGTIPTQLVTTDVHYLYVLSV
jgi:hypothetical protein